MAHLALHHESSPAYKCLRDAGLLENAYRKKTADDLDLWPPNSSIVRNKLNSCIPGILTARINDGEIGMLNDGRGHYEFLAPGLHCYHDPFYSLKGKVELKKSSRGPLRSIEFGDRCIVTIPQGFIGVASDCGQPLLLPPGIHQWKSPTVHFLKTVDLTAAVIHIDPYTLVTVDEGYSAVTQDNGRMIILDGGSTYMLQHRNHKFEMFISQKLQTDQLRGIKCASADNVVIAVQATVNWRILDVETAARMAADTMLHGGGRIGNSKHSQLNAGSDDVHINNEGSLDLGKLRNDVLKQAEASLSAFIALVNYSSCFGVSASVSKERRKDSIPVVTASQAEVKTNDVVVEAQVPESAALFDLTKLQSMVGHANEVTQIYGVEILSINIIQAFPADDNLMKSLAKGAVAAAEAQQAETSAKGKAVAERIRARAKAESTVTVAKAEAEAEIIRAEGSKKAADTMNESEVAVELARIDRTGKSLGDNKVFFFGSTPGGLVKHLATKTAMGA